MSSIPNITDRYRPAAPPVHNGYALDTDAATVTEYTARDHDGDPAVIDATEDALYGAAAVITGALLTQPSGGLDTLNHVRYALHTVATDAIGDDVADEARAAAARILLDALGDRQLAARHGYDL